MRAKRSSISVVVSLVLLVAVASILLFSALSDKTPATSLNGVYFGSGTTHVQPYNPASEDLDPVADATGSVSGSLLDDGGIPIRGVEVELVPLSKTGDEQWNATKRDWTNAEGSYRFTAVDRGEYLVAVQKDGAPDGRHPYAAAYYQGAEHEFEASHVYVTADAIELHPMRLRRLQTVTVKVTVQFQDGTRPRWSNLLFHNSSFPNQAVIGDEAPGITDGAGQIDLPVGFEYYANAKVDCDAGSRIDTRESRPVQKFRVSATEYPTQLEFIIPGQLCPPWSPK